VKLRDLPKSPTAHTSSRISSGTPHVSTVKSSGGVENVDEARKSEKKTVTPSFIDAPRVVVDAPTSKAAARELEKHAAELGVPLTGDVAKAIQAAEVALGQKADHRVSSADMERAVKWSEQAAKLEPARQNALFGFTRVVDAKLHDTHAKLDVLSRAVVASGVTEAQLWKAIDEGPGGGEIVWKTPKTPVELVASIVRQMVIAGGASRQLAITPELAKWLDDTLGAAGEELKRAMGGAGAFAANIGSAIGVTSSFYSTEEVPKAIVDRFADGVKIVDGKGNAHLKGEFVSDAPARTNIAAEYSGGQKITILGKDVAKVNGKAVDLVTGGSGRVILGTQAKDIKPGFDGVDEASLKKIAKANDMFFFVGAHYLTQGTAVDAKAAAEKLARDLDVMKAANPSLLRHAQYVVPKVPENETVVLVALKGHVDSLALNSVEAAPLMDALHDAGMTKFDIDPNIPREAAEDPAQMLDGAFALKGAMSLQRVHFHGLEGDLVVASGKAPGAKDPEKQKLALLRARQLASMKAANDSGEIKSRSDVFDMVASVRGTGLAAVHRFADAVQQKYGLSDVERSKVAERWWFQDPVSGDVMHFVPSRGIHDRTGGTVSLGDTIDSGALFYALEPERAPVLKHGSSFR
jgi:ADP-dependent phosphofructokinase/glucokinase